MTEPVTVVTRNKETGVLSAIIEAIFYLLLLAYAARPEAFEEIAQRIVKFGQDFLHRVSVQQALTEIRTLPETRDSE